MKKLCPVWPLVKPLSKKLTPGYKKFGLIVGGVGGGLAGWFLSGGTPDPILISYLAASGATGGAVGGKIGMPLAGKVAKKMKPLCLLG